MLTSLQQLRNCRAAERRNAGQCDMRRQSSRFDAADNRGRRLAFTSNGTLPNKRHWFGTDIQCNRRRLSFPELEIKNRDSRAWPVYLKSPFRQKCPKLRMILGSVFSRWSPNWTRAWPRRIEMVTTPGHWRPSFPELKVYLTQDRAWKERFHQNMLDAVALGMMISVKCRRGWRHALANNHEALENRALMTPSRVPAARTHTNLNEPLTRAQRVAQPSIWKTTLAMLGKGIELVSIWLAHLILNRRVVFEQMEPLYVTIR